MDLLYSRCAGLDVHKDSVVACARVVSERDVRKDVETFGTTTEALLKLSDWLTEHGCTHVAMEATGVYWKPVWHVLGDGGFELILANAAHVKNVPGRKTDVNDATWLAELLAHGLIRPSFVPDTATEEMRTLLRTRKQLVREKASHTQRLQKTLEDANIKLDSVISDVLGLSGRAMIEALIGGETDPAVLAGLARRLKAPDNKLQAALRGRVTRHHRFLLRLHLNQIDALDAAMAEIDAEVEAHLAPFRTAIRLLTSIPGISNLGAQVIVSEIGTDMDRFPTAGHLLSWAGLCPRNDESAGKRRSTRLRKGAPWLKTLLVQCAWAASRKKDSYFQAQFHRLRSRRGAKKAICAVAASILTAAYHMLKDGTVYQDLGHDHFDKRSKDAQTKRLVSRLAKLGYDVEIKPATAAA
ncbi:MAG: transposase IS116/IS110/IS902 family protein [Stygiobacter sp.]|nr:MAG: transposase IS116/IS110/IS902 family protein [Stygiobacter sp.]